MLTGKPAVLKHEARKEETDQSEDLNYLELEFAENNDTDNSTIIGADNVCEYTTVHPVSLPEHKPLKQVSNPQKYVNLPVGQVKRLPMAYEQIEVNSNYAPSLPQMDIFEVLEDHKCPSMSEKRLSVRRGDFVQAEKTEASRVLCVLVDQTDSPRGWIPMSKLKRVYTNDKKPSSDLQEAPAIPPKSPGLINCLKHPGMSSQPWLVGIMSREKCEEIFKKQAKEKNFVIRESTFRVGDYTLSVQHEGKVHHFPIEITDDKKYFIGKFKFKSLSSVVSYYQRNALFYDSKNGYVTLGEPLLLK